MVRDSTILFATAGLMLAAIGMTGAIVSEQMLIGDVFVLFLGVVILGFIAYLVAAVSLRNKGE